MKSETDMRPPPFALPHTAKLMIAYFAVYVIWGSTYYAISVAVKELPPLYVAGLRYTAAGFALMLYNFLRGEKLPVGREWLSPIVVAIFVLVLTNGATTIACLLIPSGVVALLQSSIPSMTVLWDRFVFHKEVYRMKHYLGILVGVVGVVVLVLARNRGGLTFSVQPAGVGIVLFGAACWSFGCLLGKDIPAPASHAMNSGLSMAIAGPLFLLLGSIVDWRAHYTFAALSSRGVLAIAYLSVFGSIIAFCSHCWLMRVEPPSRVATSTFVNPAIAMFLGSAFGGEVLTKQMLLGAAAILFSVSLIWKK